MAAQLRFLDSDRVTPFSSHSFGNVLAGNPSVPKLVFMDSYGDAAAISAESGLETVSGNDGITFAQISEMAEMTALSANITGTVEGSGGSIPSGTVLEYKVTVKDRWGHESEVCSTSFQPTIASNNSKVNLSWDAVAEAFKYIVYSKIGGGSYYKVAEASTNAYIDLTGTNDGATTPPAAGSVAYKVGSWGSAAIVAGDMAPGAKKPIGYRMNVPAGTSSTGNPRQFRGYVAMLTA